MPRSRRYLGDMARPPVSTVADQIFYSTVHINATTPAGMSTGTGFLVQYDIAGGQAPILITNKHVLAGATSVDFTMPRSLNGEPVSAGTRMTANEFSDAVWHGHPQPEVDIAVMKFAPVLEAMAALGAPPFYRAFGDELLLTSADADQLDSIESVTFVGYPSGLFDRASMLPIARRGQTATPIFNDYNQLPAFLIDASVFPGSSGSPVLILDRGIYSTRDGVTQVGNRVMLAGVVAAVHTRTVMGEIRITSNAYATFDDMIDLGIVFKSSAIQETVDILFAAEGITSPSAPDPEVLA